jgi:ketosteroid isomerase-like protein
MTLSHADLLATTRTWLEAWAAHDLERVLALMDDEVRFENWTGIPVTGKAGLRAAWTPWFADHGNFVFAAEDLFADAASQQVLLRWSLDWPSQERAHRGQPEIRRGVDVLRFRAGRIVEKLTYSKTTLIIAGRRVGLSA